MSAHWLGHGDKAMLDRCIQMTIPPGSVFKPLTAIAILESLSIDSTAPLTCRGYLREPDRQRCLIYRRFGVGHGPTDLSSALAVSCNVYFFHYAGHLGPAPLVNWAARFGFGQRTGIKLPAEAQGNLPSPRWKQQQERTYWQTADTEAMAIGQGALTVTPMQIVRMMATIANGGILLTPRIVADRELGDYRSDVTKSESASGVRIPWLSAKSLEAVRNGLLKTVEHPSGTAHSTVRISDLAVAGKTGTAQAGQDQQDHAWFAGYAPADAPLIAFVVALEHAGSGSENAGPVARELLTSMLRHETLANLPHRRHD